MSEGAAATSGYRSRAVRAESGIEAMLLRWRPVAPRSAERSAAGPAVQPGVQPTPSSATRSERPEPHERGPDVRPAPPRGRSPTSHAAIAPSPGPAALDAAASERPCSASPRPGQRASRTMPGARTPFRPGRHSSPPRGRGRPQAAPGHRRMRLPRPRVAATGRSRPLPSTPGSLVKPPCASSRRRDRRAVRTGIVFPTINDSKRGRIGHPSR